MASPLGVSSPFKIGSVQQANNGTLAYEGEILQFAFTDSDNDLQIATANVSAFLKSGSRSAFTWQIQQVSKLFPLAESLTFQGSPSSGPAYVSLGGFNYLFWCDTSGPVAVMRSGSDGSEPACTTLYVDPAVSAESVQPVQPSFAPSVTASSSSSGIASTLSATVVPDGSMIALQFLMPAKEQYTLGAKQTPLGASLFVTCLFDPALFDPTSSWRGTYAAIMLDGGGNGSMVESYGEISAAWIALGGKKPSSHAQQPELFYYQIVSGYGGSYQAKTYAWEVNGHCLPLYGTPKKRSWIPQTPALIAGIGDETNSVMHGVFLIRDPAGAVLALYCAYGTGGAPPEGQVMAAWFDPSTQMWVRNKAIEPTVNSELCPSAVFLPLPITQGPSPCALPTPDGKTTKVFDNCTLQKQILFIATTQGSGTPWQPEGLIRFYGTSVTLPNYSSAAPTTGAPKMALSLVADSFPYPIPNAAAWGDSNSSPSGTVDWQACAYQYLVGNQTEAEVQIETDAIFGMRNGSSTTLGVGPTSEGSLSTGARSTFESSRSSYNATSFIVSTKGLPSTSGTPGNAQTFNVSPNGTLFGRGYPTLLQTVCVFVDPLDEPLYGPAYAPLTAMVQAGGSPSSIGGQFTTYCYTPGNLLSYAPATIDTTMQTLYANLLKTDPAGAAVFTNFKINGKSAADYYTNGKYIEEIVKDFGANCFGQSGNLSYLEFSFSESGAQESEFQETTQFTNAGNFFIDASWYVGMGAGLGLNVFGIGEQVSSYLMLGTELSFSLTQGSSQTASWGLSLTDYLNPLASGEAYTARLYFLKPSRLWSLELQYFGNANASIDLAHSAPVRILFTVPYISSSLTSRLTTLF